MRIRIALLGSLAFLLAPGAVGAAGTGTIEGVVVDGNGGDPVADVEVTLTSALDGADPTTEAVRTDERGRYSFPNLPTGEGNVYALDARYDGGLFPGRAITIPDDTDETPVIDTTIRVWSTTTDPAAIVVARDDLFVAPNAEGRLGAIEAFQVTNTSEEAYIGRGGGNGGPSTPSLGFPLPVEAQQESIQIIDSSLDIPELVRTDFGFGITTAIPPGRFTITYSYAVSGTAATYDLSRRALYPTLNFTIFAGDGLEISSDKLVEREPIDIEGEEYLEHSTDGELNAGDTIQVVALGDAGTPPGLIAGMAGVLALVLVLGAVPLIRSRRRRESPAPRTRDEVLREIAELDLRHERGEVDAEEWARRRADLKAESARSAGGPG